MEEDISGGHNDVRNNTTRSDEIDEPFQDDLRAVANLQERQTGEDHNHGEAENRHAGHGTFLDGLGQEMGRAAFKRHSVQ